MDLITSTRLAILACAVLVYCVALAVYRLYLSPLARFPGPKLAALTLWYEFYYDVVKRGRYQWKIKEMHEKYGESLMEDSEVNLGNIDRDSRPDHPH